MLITHTFVKVNNALESSCKLLVNDLKFCIDYYRYGGSVNYFTGWKLGLFFNLIKGV